MDRTLESRVDWDRFSATREEHRTVVKPFPISVPWGESQNDESEESAYDDRAALLRELGVNASLLGVGVDRVDYTKGILERFLAVERLLERYPAYRGKFSFIQIGAPSRTHIKRYHDLLGEVEVEADRINWRFQEGSWKPIILLKWQHSHREIQRYYRVADICLVTSLHDGMNLVAKEFLAARSDEQGVLILSQFTRCGARSARRFDRESIRHRSNRRVALRYALEMPAEERQARMRRMREKDDTGKQRLRLGGEPDYRTFRPAGGLPAGTAFGTLEYCRLNATLAPSDYSLHRNTRSRRTILSYRYCIRSSHHLERPCLPIC